MSKIEVDQLDPQSGTELTIGSSGDTIKTGGNLDTNNNNIVTSSNRDLNLYPNGTGAVEIGGNTNPGTIILNCESNSHGIKLQSPAHSAGQSYTLKFPTGNVTADTFLKVDSVSGSGATGVGQLSFGQVSSDWVKIIQTNVTSNAATVSFVNGTGGVVLDSTYRIYKLIGSYRGDTNGAEFQIRVMNSGSARTSGYLCEVFRSYYSGGTSRASATDKIVRSNGGVQAAAGQRGNFEATFFNMFDTDHNTTAHCQFCAVDGSGETENQVNNGISSGVYATPEAHNGLEFSMSSGNVAEAEFTLVGLKG